MDYKFFTIEKYYNLDGTPKYWVVIFHEFDKNNPPKKFPNKEEVLQMIRENYKKEGKLEKELYELEAYRDVLKEWKYACKEGEVKDEMCLYIAQNNFTKDDFEKIPELQKEIRKKDKKRGSLKWEREGRLTFDAIFFDYHTLEIKDGFSRLPDSYTQLPKTEEMLLKKEKYKDYTIGRYFYFKEGENQDDFYELIPPEYQLNSLDLAPKYLINDAGEREVTLRETVEAEKKMEGTEKDSEEIGLQSAQTASTTIITHGFQLD